MGNKKKYLLLFVTGSLLVAACLGYYFYNKPAIDVRNARAQLVSAKDLYATFTEDSLTAKKSFVHKILEVSGSIIQASQNQQHQTVLLLKTGTEGAAVNCTLEGPATNIKSHQTITIKGICNGMGEGDPDLGIVGDVYLIRCYILNSNK